MTNYCTGDFQLAVLQLPAGSLGEPRQLDCVFQEMRGSRLSIECPVGVPCSTAVSLKFEDAMYLGEVMSSSTKAGSWQVEIQVEQVLSGLGSLMALRKQLMSEQTVSPLAAVPAGVRN